MAVKPLLIGFCMLAAWPAAAGCLEQAQGGEDVILEGLDRAGDPLLSDGRVLRLVDIAPRQDEAETARFAAGLKAHAWEELRLATLGTADRWGRLPARLFRLGPDGSPTALSLAKGLIDAGSAQAWPDAAFPECDTVPAVATAKRPVRNPPQPAQAAPSPDIVDGHDIAALKAQAGRLVAVEGRVASVGERPQRVYLNFSRRRGEAGAVSMSRKLWLALQAAGWTQEGLSGKRIRARGVLSGQEGTLLDIDAVSALELID